MINKTLARDNPDLCVYNIVPSSAIRCSEPEEISNGDVDRKCQTFGCRISYTCRPGYELVNKVLRKF
jgi:hypothetical protein